MEKCTPLIDIQAFDNIPVYDGSADRGVNYQVCLWLSPSFDPADLLLSNSP